MRSFIAAALFLFPTLVFAGSGLISGSVTTVDNKPVEFAVVTLLSAKDSSLVKGGVTDATGAFRLEQVPADSFHLVISCTGFKKKTITGIVLSEGQELSVPAVSLEANDQLNGVTITAAQPLYVQKPGMLVMNVENSPVKMSATVWELLQTAPGIFIDQDGNISLKGKAGARVYIDGKNTFLSGEQLKNYLLSMPASSVVRIEIITNPSAKYDAEGNAGIINIVTQRGSRQGFNGSAYAAVGQGVLIRTFGGIYFNYGRPKYNLYGKYDYESPWGKDDHRVYKTIAYNDVTTKYDQRTIFTFHPFIHTARFGIDFTPNQKTTWGLRVDGSRDVENIWTDNLSVLSPDSGSALRLNQQNHLRGRFMNAGAGAYFNTNLDTNGQEISGSIDYLRYYDRTNETYEVTPIDESGNPNGNPLYQRSQSNNDISIYVGQVDYVKPFSKWKLEAGLKSSYVKTANELIFEIENGSVWDYDSTRSNTFTYIEQINAAYVNSSLQLGKWDFMAGVRAEQTNSDGISPTMQQEVKRTYLEFFPSLFVTHNISKKHVINYSVSRRINRPAYSELNPFLFYLDQYTYKAGNPFLQPEIAWNGEISYTYDNWLTLDLSASHRDSAMTSISHQEDSTGIIYQTTVNLNATADAYFGLTITHDFTSWWSSECSAGVTWAHFQSTLYGSSFEHSNTAFNADLTETFMLPKGYKVQLSGWYQSTTYYGIFVFHPQGAADLALSKSFLNNKLQCAFAFRDMFHTQILNLHVDFDNEDIRVHHIPDSRSVTVRVRYNFGNAKAARKSEFKSGADDLKQRAG